MLALLRVPHFSAAAAVGKMMTATTVTMETRRSQRKTKEKRSMGARALIDRLPRSRKARAIIDRLLPSRKVSPQILWVDEKSKKKKKMDKRLSANRKNLKAAPV